MSNADKESGLPSSAAASGQTSWVRTLVFGLMLIAVWLVWSGFFKPLLLGLGAVSCLLTLYLVRRMGYLEVTSSSSLNYFGFVGYLAWLLKEIVLSSLQVTRIVLSRELDLKPRMIDLDASELSLGDQVLLGNSITLTPGTLTLDVHDGRLIVHALSEEGAAALETGEMQRRVAALRGG